MLSALSFLSSVIIIEASLVLLLMLDSGVVMVFCHFPYKVECTSYYTSIVVVVVVVVVLL